MQIVVRSHRYNCVYKYVFMHDVCDLSSIPLNLPQIMPFNNVISLNDFTEQMEESKIFYSFFFSFVSPYSFWQK